MIVIAVIAAVSTVIAVYAVYRSERGVAITVGTDKNHYAPGEPVQISMLLKNYGFDNVELVFCSSIIMRCEIYDSDGMVEFFYPKAGLAVMTYVDLGPGESRSGGYSWNQVNETGEQVELPGTFTVRALSRCSGQNYSASATFTISY